jgi:hypothetical protein
MRRALCLALLAGVASGCQDTAGNQMTAPEGAPPPRPAVVATSPAVVAGEKLTYVDASDRVLLRIKITANGFALSDADAKPLGTVKKGSDQVTYLDAGDVERLKVKKTDDGALVEDAAQKEVYRLKADEGVWTIDDATGAPLAKVKTKPDGLELRAKDGGTIARLKSSEDKVVFENEQGERLALAKGTTRPQAAVWLALDKLSLAERAALWAYFETAAPAAP